MGRKKLIISVGMSLNQRFRYSVWYAIIKKQWRIQDLTLGGGGVDFINAGGGGENHWKGWRLN